MPNTFNSMAIAVSEPTFARRVKLAMIQAATQIAGEAQGGRTLTQYNKRQRLATLVLTKPYQWEENFALAVASQSAVATAIGNPVNITSSTNANPTVITASGHGLATGNEVLIRDHAVNTNANGGWTVTVVNATTFSIPTPANGVGGATGTITKQPSDADISTAVASLWDDIAGIRSTD